MVERWYAVIIDRTGELHSVCQTLADPMPQGLVVKTYDYRPDQNELMVWSPLVRDWVPRPI